MKRREPPFIDGEEGIFEKRLIPSWKAQNQPSNALNLGYTT
jgi:hypothetical protein